jgi:hypothetical protein
MPPLKRRIAERGRRTVRLPALAFWVLALLLAACQAGGGGPSSATTASASASVAPSAATSPTGTAEDPCVESGARVYEGPDFGPLEPATYCINPDQDPTTTLHVLYTIPADGWLAFIGSFKGPVDEATGRDQSVQVNILNVTNLVTDGCENHVALDPPVGPTVDGLATALTELAPFEVVEAPTDVTFDGYAGRHLILTTPDLPVEVNGGNLRFTECMSGEVKSWIGRPLSYAYYGYSPGQIEEFWILDVDGNRLMISAAQYPDSPPGDVAEMQALLDSIDIEP